jgi:hypothetical protein
VKNSGFILGILVLFGLAFTGCNKGGGTTTSGQTTIQDISPTGPVTTQTAVTSCLLPRTMTDLSSSKPSSLSEIKTSLNGKYELDEVHIYQIGKTSDGNANGSFYGKATRSLNDLSIGNDSVSDTKMTFPCTDFDEKATVPFLSGITVPVAGTVYFPSGRITVFDENSGSYDDPQFNFPSIADVHFDSLGLMSYKPLPNERVSGPPYNTNRYIDDLVGMWPDGAQFYLRNSGGFEVRFSQTDDRNISDGKDFKATSYVLVTYKKSDN